MYRISKLDMFISMGLYAPLNHGAQLAVLTEDCPGNPQRRCLLFAYGSVNPFFARESKRFSIIARASLQSLIRGFPWTESQSISVAIEAWHSNSKQKSKAKE